MSLWSRNIPLLAEEGWLRHQKNAAKPPKRRSRGGQTGATSRRTSIEASPYRARASRHPLRGGECAPPTTSPRGNWISLRTELGHLLPQLFPEFLLRIRDLSLRPFLLLFLERFLG